jgi:hypothetical protein
MSLIKKHEMTERKLAANRQNQKLCHDSLTDERRERIQAALRRFGYNTQAEEAAMRAVGEEPADFQELLEGLWEEWSPSGTSQEGVVISLARALWLMNRAARMQEGCAVRQATEVSSGREDRAHARMMRLKMTEDSLGQLAHAVAYEHYVTTPADLEKMKNLHQEGALKDMGEIALALFYQLQAPGTGEDGIDPEERNRNVVRKIKGIFGITPDPEDLPANASKPLEEGRDARYPRITPAEWEARERPRQLLENILTRQVDTCQAQRKAAREESRKGPSPYERAAEIAPTHPDARLMRRMQDSNLREVRRLTNLLLKIKRYERQMEALAKTAALQDIQETKGVSRLE